MNLYCNDIILDIFPFKDIAYPNMLPRVIHQTLNIEEYINPSLVEFLKTKGIFISHLEVFTYWQICNSHIHVDGDGNDMTKLNWIIGGEGSSVKWYKIKSTNSPVPAITMANTSAIRFSPLDVEEVLHIHPANKNPCLFQAGIPHQGIPSSALRFCVSTVLRHSSTRKFVKYQEALALFQDLII